MVNFWGENETQLGICGEASFSKKINKLMVNFIFVFLRNSYFILKYSVIINYMHLFLLSLVGKDIE